MGSLGDVARGLAIVPLLRQAYPQLKLTWLIEPKCRGLIELVPGIDEVLVFERGSGLSALLKLKRELAARTFDLTLDLQRHFKSGVFSWLSGAKRRIGFHRHDAKELNWLFQTETIAPFGENLPKIQHYLKFVEHLGIHLQGELSFGVQKSDVEKFLPEQLQPIAGRYIAVVLGSAWKSKDWVLEGYQELLTELSHGADSIVLLGDRSTVELAATLQNLVASPRIMNLSGATNLPQMIAVMSAARLGIGPDSGPGHVAALFDVPYIALFGPTDPVRTAPYGSEDLVLKSNVACSPCYRRNCPGLGGVCMRLITPHAVLDRIKDLSR